MEIFMRSIFLHEKIFISLPSLDILMFSYLNIFLFGVFILLLASVEKLKEFFLMPPRISKKGKKNFLFF